MSNFIKKLNNFRFTALLMTIVSGVGALYSLASLLLYHFSHGLEPNFPIRYVGFHGLEAGPYLGMVLFFMSIISFSISLFIMYSLIPFLKNQDKVNPRRGLLMAGFVNAFVTFVLFVFMVLLIILDKPNTLVGIILSYPFGLAAIAGFALFIIPFKKCDFYMPAIK